MLNVPSKWWCKKMSRAKIHIQKTTTHTQGSQIIVYKNCFQ